MQSYPVCCGDQIFLILNSQLSWRQAKYSIQFLIPRILFFHVKINVNALIRLFKFKSQFLIIFFGCVRFGSGSSFYNKNKYLAVDCTRKIMVKFQFESFCDVGGHQKRPNFNHTKLNVVNIYRWCGRDSGQRTLPTIGLLTCDGQPNGPIRSFILIEICVCYS